MKHYLVLKYQSKDDFLSCTYAEQPCHTAHYCSAIQQHGGPQLTKGINHYPLYTQHLYEPKYNSYSNKNNLGISYK